MYSIDDMLKRKESQAERLRGEIEALRLAAHIMEESDERPIMAAPSRQESQKAWP